MTYLDENGKAIFCCVCDNEAEYKVGGITLCYSCYDAFRLGQDNPNEDVDQLCDIEEYTFKEDMFAVKV